MQDFDQNVNNFDQFSKELQERNIDQFNNDDLRAMYDAGVSATFIAQLHEAGVLELFNSEQLIEIFNEK